MRIRQLVPALFLARTLLAVEVDEPTVTRREAAVLEQAVDLAVTNAAGAIALLAGSVSPKNSAALDFALGNFYLQADRPDEAIGAYGRAVAKLPGFVRARKNLGRAYLLGDQPAEAVGVYQALVTDRHMDRDVLLLLGHGLRMEGETAGAESAYRQALMLAPRDGDAMQGLAKCLVAQARYPEAEVLLTTLLVRDPGRRELWSLKANVQLALDKVAAAAVSLETARRLGVADADMLMLLGDLYLNRAQSAEALAVYAQAAGGSAARLLRAAAGFVQVGDGAGATALLERVGQGDLAPEEAVSRDRLRADVARLAGERETAIAGYRAVLRRRPMDGEALLALGELLYRADLFEEAAMAFERAARIAGHEAAALLWQAQVEVERGRYARAVELLEAAQAFESRPHVARYLAQVRRLAAPMARRK